MHLEKDIIIQLTKKGFYSTLSTNSQFADILCVCGHEFKLRIANYKSVCCPKCKYLKGSDEVIENLTIKVSVLSEQLDALTNKECNQCSELELEVDSFNKEKEKCLTEIGQLSDALETSKSHESFYFQLGEKSKSFLKKEFVQDEIAFRGYVKNTGGIIPDTFVFRGGRDAHSVICPSGNKLELCVSRTCIGHHANPELGTNCCEKCSIKYYENKIRMGIETKGGRFLDRMLFKSSNIHTEYFRYICSNGHNIKLLASSALLEDLGYDCPVCINYRDHEIKKTKFEEIVYNSNFNFVSDVRWLGVSKNILLICPNGHELSITPCEVLNHTKPYCLKCASIEAESARTLYWIQFTHPDYGEFWKIGLEGIGLERFSRAQLSRANISIVSRENFVSSNHRVKKLENYIIRTFSDHRIDMSPLLNVSSSINGGTECFSIDITNGVPFEEFIQTIVPFV